MYIDPIQKKEAETKFKELGNAYNYFKRFHNTTNNFDNFSNNFNGNFYGNMENEEDFKNFTEKLINKGNILHSIINNAKNLDLKEFFSTFMVHIKKFRFMYDDMFSNEQTQEMLVNVNVSLEDIYNKEDKLIELKRIRKCDKCYNNDLKFCKICNNKNYLEQSKSFIFNCSDKIIVFSTEGNEDKNKKSGDIIIKIHPKVHSEFKLINNYDILYEIYTNKLENITHSFVYLDKQKMVFTSEYPFRKEYIFEDKGLPIPYSDTLGKLIIKIIYVNYEINNNSKFNLI
jgi:DnaJ-class molecular chaperone